MNSLEDAYLNIHLDENYMVKKSSKNNAGNT